MKIQIKTLIPLVLAAALTACSPFTDDPVVPVNDNTGEGVTISRNGNALTANISDVDGVDYSTATYQWYSGAVAVVPRSSNTLLSRTPVGTDTSTYTLGTNEDADDITVEVSYTDLSGTAESFTASSVAAGEDEVVIISRDGNDLSANLTDKDGFGDNPVTYTWYLNGTEITTATGSSYTLEDGQSVGDISVSVSYIDNANNPHAFTSEPATAPNKVASITDNATDDSGELRYKLDSGVTQGKVSMSVMYPEGETEKFYIVLFGSSTSGSNTIGELQMDTGKFTNRTQDSSSSALSAADFEEGTFVDVVLKWDLSVANNGTYTIELPGTGWSETFDAYNLTIADVQNIQMKLSSTSGTADYAVEVDNLVVSELQADGSYTELFADDFDTHVVGQDLVASPYSTNGFSAVVAESSIAAPSAPVAASNYVASITDNATDDAGELRYKLGSGITQGKVSLSVMYPEGETEKFYVVLFGSSTSGSNTIGELQMDTGKYTTRTQSDSSSDLTAADFTEGTSVDVVLTWDLSDSNATTYTIELPGQNWTATQTTYNTTITDVQNIQMKLSSTSGTAANAVEVDNLVISELQADGTYTEVWSDDFDDYAIGRDLVASPYSTSGHSAVVAESSL